MSNKREPTSRELGSHKRIKPPQLHMPTLFGKQQTPSWAMSPNGEDSMHAETYSGEESPPALPPPVGLPTPNTSPNYFMGSDDIDRYIIDLDHTNPNDFDPDIQAYLERVARSHNGEPFDDEAYIDEFEDQDDNGIPQHPQPYVPDIALVTQGLDNLRQARERAPGLWFKREDITASDLERFPHYPWLGSMIRRLGEEEAVRRVESLTDDDRSGLILGNVRIGLPTDLAGPKRNTNWGPLIGVVYGSQHPADVWSSNPWFEDEHVDAWIRWSVSWLGGPTLSRPSFPVDPSLSPSSPIHIGYWRRNDGVEDRVW